MRRDGDAFENGGGGNQSVPGSEDFQFGLNGEAFVPDALPGQGGGGAGGMRRRQENEPVITHGQHARRTAELRAEAARVREREGLSAGGGGAGGGRGDAPESFPSLGADSSAAASLVGWTSDGARSAGLTRTPVGQVTSEVRSNPPSGVSEFLHAVCCRAKQKRPDSSDGLANTHQ